MTRKKQGFASFDPDKLREVSSRGGKTPRKEPTGFARLSPERLKEVSRKGGLKSKRGKISKEVS